MRLPRALIVVASLFCTSVADSQSVHGVLTGIVSSDGVALPGAMVSVSSAALQGTRTVVTGDDGAYRFVALPPGRYTITFEAPGMETVRKTIEVYLAQVSRMDAQLHVAAVSEDITVIASAAGVVDTAEVTTNFRQRSLEELPTKGRTILDAVLLAPGVSPEGIRNQPRISGGASYENLYLVDGAVINNLGTGQPDELYIEDALQETTVITGSVSAEYGRFTGGLVSAITRSGGNEFSASLRDSLSNSDWTRKTPFAAAADAVDDVNHVWEATLGGRVLRDRLWFFTAGRYRETARSLQTTGTEVPFQHGEEETRWEAKLTGAVTPKITVVGSWLDRLTKEQNRFSGPIVDLRSLTEAEFPTSLLSLHGNAAVTQNLLVEALVSRSDATWVGAGAKTRDLISGTTIRDVFTGDRGWAPSFCGVCGESEFDNEYRLLKASWFSPVTRFGSHTLITGAEDFSEQREGDNHFGGSGYRVWGKFQFTGPEVFLEMIPGVSFIESFPILQTGGRSDATVVSYFLTDRWDLGSRWNFNIGVRHDRTEAVDRSGTRVSDQSTTSPRVSAIWNLRNDGRHRLFAGFGRYLARLHTGFAVVEAQSAAGTPAQISYSYRGPHINGAAPYLPTDEVLRQVFAWYASIGGDKANPDRGARLPGVNTRFDGELKNPTMDEITLGYGAQFSRGVIRADLIAREWENFYVDSKNLANGTITDSRGTEYDLILVGNDSAGLRREYEALQVQGEWRPLNTLAIGGNYTLSELKGNTDSENPSGGAITIPSARNLPEYVEQEWNNPVRHLDGDSRHRAQLWLSFDFATRLGRVGLSVLEVYQSGFPYYAIGEINLGPVSNGAGILNPGYVTPPATARYYFLDQGTFRTNTLTRTDLAINYSLRMRGIEMFLQTDVLNLFDESAVVDPTFLNVTVYTARNAQCVQSPSGSSPGSACAPFNPFTTHPVRGTHYQFHPGFGEPTAPAAYQLPLTFQASVGVRF